jgi:two-component system response regulator (stage 0 sporulation protein A)
MNIACTLNFGDSGLNSVVIGKEDLLKLITTGRVTLNPTSSRETPEKPLNLESEATALLSTIGIPRHIKGFNYLREAVLECLSKPDAINNVTKVLYPDIAAKHNDTASRVERSIRHAIESSWVPKNIETINRLFVCSYSPDGHKAVNAEFIALIADHLRLANNL